jgi:hypothetical protein
MMGWMTGWKRLPWNHRLQEIGFLLLAVLLFVAPLAFVLVLVWHYIL